MKIVYFLYLNTIQYLEKTVGTVFHIQYYSSIVQIFSKICIFAMYKNVQYYVKNECLIHFVIQYNNFIVPDISKKNNIVLFLEFKESFKKISFVFLYQYNKILNTILLVSVYKNTVYESCIFSAKI